MERELHKVTIIPAIFLRNEDGKSVVRCLLDNDKTEDRYFDTIFLNGIENPKYLFIGFMTGVGYIQCDFCDAGKYEELFSKMWDGLINI
jgi:hypothetical protein